MLLNGNSALLLFIISYSFLSPLTAMYSATYSPFLATLVVYLPPFRRRVRVPLNPVPIY